MCCCCGGSVVILKVYVRGAGALEPERHPPIPRHFHRPRALSLPFQLVEPVAGQIHVLRAGSRVQAGKYAPQFVGVVELSALAFAALSSSRSSTPPFPGQLILKNYLRIVPNITTLFIPFRGSSSLSSDWSARKERDRWFRLDAGRSGKAGRMRTEYVSLFTIIVQC